MEAILLKLFSFEALLLCVAIGILVEAVKKTFQEFFKKKWPNRLLNVIPLFVGAGASLLPGLFGQAYAVKVLLGIVCGGVSTLSYKVLKRVFKKVENDSG